MSATGRSFQTVARKEMRRRSDHIDARHRFFGAAPAFYEKEIRVKGKHPDLLMTHVRCSTCGTEFTTRTVRESLTLEVCADCHPAYTGVERPIAQGSRIERFERRRLRAATA